MLHPRQQKILQILEKNKWVLGKELAETLSVSDRTIRNDIATMNQIYDNMILSNSHFGYQLKERSVSENMPPGYSCAFHNPQERAIFMLKKILFTQGSTYSFSKICKELYIGEDTLKSDLKQMRQISLPYEVELKYQKEFLVLQGDEKNKRKLYKYLLSQEITDNFLNLSKLANLFLHVDILKIRDTLQVVFEEEGIEISGLLLPLLILHIGIAIERMKSNHLVFGTCEKKDTQRVGYTLAEKIYQKLGIICGIEIPQEEIFYLSRLLAGRGDLSKELGTETTDGLNETLIFHLVEEINQTLDLNLQVDEEFLIGMLTHMNSFLFRFRHGVELHNPLLAEIKKNYPLVFEVGIKVAQYFEHRLGVVLNEDEIGFITLHLGAAFERQSVARKYQAVLISPFQSIHTQGVCEKISSIFGQNLHIIKSCTHFNEKEIKKLHPDFMITTVDMEEVEHFPWVKISLFFNREDREMIGSMIGDCEKRRYQKEVRENMLGWFREQLFFHELSLSNSQEIISFLAQRVEDLGLVEPFFVQNVLRREAISSTSFQGMFALPHPIELNAKQSSIAVAILKKPILWGDYSVKFVMLLSIAKEDRKMLKLVFDWFGNILEDPNKFRTLIGCTSFQSFMEEVIY